MKHLKFIFLPIVIISLFSFVKANDCDFDGIAYYCDAGETCQGTQCECDGAMISSGTACGTICYDDGISGICDAGEYCAGPNPCDCDGITISVGVICNPAPPPPASCTRAGVTLFNGQFRTFYQSNTVPYTGTCSSIQVLTQCNVVGGIGTLNPSVVGYNYSGCIVSPPPTGACTTPRGTTVNSGDIATGYTTSSVACGSSCIYETRTCSNGDWYNNGIQIGFSSNINYGSCSINSCSSGGGSSGGGSSGGGSSTNTTGTTTSGSTTETGNLPIGSIVGSTRSTELNNAYLRAYAHGITTMNTITKANMGGVLYRAHMAKMISNFALSLGELVPNTGRDCTFNDISNQSSELRFYIKLSCQLGLMGLNANGIPDQEFNPEGLVTRAQFGTILSRVLRGSLYNGGDPYYSPHLLALKNVGIMTQITNPISVNEIRGYVMIMMKRAFEGGFLNN